MFGTIDEIKLSELVVPILSLRLHILIELLVC